jgi:hypothetical protein
MNFREHFEKNAGLPGAYGEALRRIAHAGRVAGSTPVPRAAVAARYKGEALKARMNPQSLAKGERLPDIPQGEVRAEVDRVVGKLKSASVAGGEDYRLAAFLEGFQDEMEKTAGMSQGALAAVNSSYRRTGQLSNPVLNKMWLKDAEGRAAGRGIASIKKDGDVFATVTDGAGKALPPVLKSPEVAKRIVGGKQARFALDKALGQ